MKHLFAVLTAICTVIGISSCSSPKVSDKNATETRSAQADGLSVYGKWRLVSYQLCEMSSNGVEIGNDKDYIFTLKENGTYGLNTDCNSIGGTFSVRNDTIRFSEVECKGMACEHMEVEQAMCEILTRPDCHAVQKDSCLYLSDDGCYNARFVRL